MQEKFPMCIPVEINTNKNEIIKEKRRQSLHAKTNKSTLRPRDAANENTFICTRSISQTAELSKYTKIFAKLYKVLQKIL